MCQNQHPWLKCDACYGTSGLCDKTYFLVVVNNIDGMWYFTNDFQDGKLTFMDCT